MTRKEVSSLLRQQEAQQACVPRIALEQRALRVVRGWLSDPRFKTRTGKPAQLTLRGNPPDFSTLVRTYGGDVTLASVLGELERTNVVTVKRGGQVRLKSRSRGMPTLANLSEFALLLSDFVDTTSQVISEKKSPVFFGYHESLVDTEGQAALFQRTFARRAAAILASADQWHQRRRVRSNLHFQKRKQAAAKVGVGIYLVEKEAKPTRSR
jgi:hypothetical protein